MIECLICGEKFKIISPTHLKKHNITGHEYKKLFSNAIFFDDIEIEKRKQRIKGDLNPAKRPEVKAKNSKLHKGKMKGDLNPARRPEVRAKISKALKGKERNDMKGNNNPMRNPEIAKRNGESRRGFHLSNESKEKMRKAKEGMYLGINNPNYGKHHSEETKIQISKANIGRLIGDKNPRWLGGKSFEPYCSKFTKNKREEIRNQYDRKCYNCGKDEKDNITKSEKIRMLSVHHIDFDKEQGCNGKKFILVPLCLECHGKVHGKNLKIKEE